jgi:deazaflavin-dependent oxidoreductase (nitroreductase family)
MDWKLFGKMHSRLYTLSGGRIASRLGGLDMILLDTIGRKTGQTRTVPLACYPYKDGMLVVAGNGGLEAEPGWWLNLKAQPEIAVQLGRERFQVVAEEMAGDEREECWSMAAEINPHIAKYQQKVSRTIAIVYLKRK